MAIGSGAGLLLSGALDGDRPVSLDRATSTTLAANGEAKPSADSPMIRYLTAMKAWTICLQDPAASCGTLPERPDDPQLNAYLGKVLDWNICASPRLRHGGMQYAVEACGPQPTSPLDG